MEREEEKHAIKEDVSKGVVKIQQRSVIRSAGRNPDTLETFWKASIMSSYDLFYLLLILLVNFNFISLLLILH